MNGNMETEFNGAKVKADALEVVNPDELNSILNESLQGLNEVGIKAVNTYAGYLLQNPWFRQDSTAEERQAYKEAEKKTIYRERMLKAAADRRAEAQKRAEEKLRVTSRYLANDTMKKLQNCTYWTLTTQGYEGQYAAGFSELLKAWKACKVTMPYIRDVAIDFWEYGMMCGIREERQNRWKKGNRGDRLQISRAYVSGSEESSESEQGHTLLIDGEVKAVLQLIDGMEPDKRQKVAVLIGQMACSGCFDGNGKEKTA